jgi:O-antigen ligase
MLRLLLAVLLIYTVNQLHFDVDLGIPGINIINLVFGAALGFMVLEGKISGLSAPSLGTPLRLYFAALTIATVVAMVARPQLPIEDLTYLKTLIFYPLYYFLFYYAVRDIKTARRLILLILVIALLAGLEAVKEGLDYGIGGYSETHRAAGPFGPDFRSANRAGVFYAMFIPMFAAPVFFLKGRPFWRMVALGGLLILAGAVLFTYSRQSYFIALLAVAFVAVRRSMVIAVACAVLFAIALPYLPQGAFERLEETQQVGQYGEAEYDDSTASRWDIWGGAVHMWSESPIGVGANRFKGLIGSYSNYPGKDAHNYYVLTLAEGGLQGFLALLFLIFALWRLSGRLLAAAVEREGWTYAQGFRVAVLAMALGNIYGSPFSEGTVMGAFWALAALLERYLQMRRAELSVLPAAAPRAQTA